MVPPVKNAENRHFCTKSDLKVLYPLVMFLKLILRIVEVYSNVLVLISKVAALNWSDTIYPNLGGPVKNPQNRHFCTKSDLKVLYPLVMFLKLILRVVDHWQRFGINDPSGPAHLKWHHIPKPKVTPSETPKIDIFDTKSHLNVLCALVMLLKLMLKIVEVPSNILVLSGRAQLKWHCIP